MTNAIDDRDVDAGGTRTGVVPVETNEKYQIDVSDNERMAAIGRLAVALITLLNQTQLKASPMAGVVVATKPREKVVAAESDPQEEQAAAILPAAEGIKTTLPPKQKEENLEKMLESYLNHVMLLTEAVKQERQLLKTREQIQLLQQLNNRSGSSINVGEDPKIVIINRIKSYEQQIKEAQAKIDELRLALQDIKG